MIEALTLIFSLALGWQLGFAFMDIMKRLGS